MCPGRYFALDELFINVASVLHVFDIGPPLDEMGRSIRIVPSQTDGFLTFVSHSIYDLELTLNSRAM